MGHRKVYSRSGVFAWSGSNVHGGGLVVAEAAQQIDLFRDSVSSFFDFVSTDDILYSDTQTSLKPTHTTKCEFKFNDLAWAPFVTSEHPAGLIIGCGESGHTSVFDGLSIKGGELQCLGVRSFHQGHVTSVSVNPIDSKWICTGGAMGSVLLWDLNDPLNAVTPGKPNFEHQIRYVSWNQCSEHILGSLTSERCSIWDLRSPGAPVLDIADIGGGVEWSAMKWSPVCGNELCMTSQNDHAPFFYKWDLRYASSAVLTYQLHTKGVLAMDWCPKDPDIVVTVGKDGQIIFQNPSLQKQIGLMTTNGWARKLSWCNMNPNMFAISYYDQPVSIYSIVPFGRSKQDNSMVDDAPFELKAIPAWLHPGPCGVSFSLGNKFCFFSKQNIPDSNSVQSSLCIGKIEGSKDLYHWAFSLLNALATNQLEDYCLKRAEVVASDSNVLLKLIWTFLSTRALNSSRFAYLSTLNLFLPSLEVQEKDLNSDLISRIKAWTLDHSSEENSGEGNEAKSDQSVVDSTELPVFSKPINLSDGSQDDYELLKLMSTNSYVESSAKALSEKNYLFALLLAQTVDNQRITKFISRSIAFDASVNYTTRIMALMCAGLWNELISLWDVQDWASLFRLIVSQAPNEQVPSLCQNLSSLMLSKGFGLYGAVPAIAAGDVEGLLYASASLSTEDQVALANILRQSLGGGSLRISSFGPKYLEVLENCVQKLVKEGLLKEAWQFIEPLETANNVGELNELKYALYEALGKPPNVLPLEDPYSEAKNDFGRLNYISSQAVNSRTSIPHAMQPSTTLYSSRSYPSQFSQAQPSQSSAPIIPPVSGYYQPPVSNYPFPPTSQNLYSNVYPTPPPNVVNGVVQQTSGAYMSGQYSQQTQRVSSDLLTSAGNFQKPVKQRLPESSSTGWNDPPQLTLKKTVYSPTVADIKWKPATFDANVDPKPIPKAQPVLTEQTQQMAVEDSKMIESFNLVIANIRQRDNSSVTSHRIADIQQKIGSELVPRLLKCSFTRETMMMLREFAGYLASFDFQSCQVIITRLVGGGDFVELSPVMPGLRALLQLAQRTFVPH